MEDDNLFKETTRSLKNIDNEIYFFESQVDLLNRLERSFNYTEPQLKVFSSFKELYQDIIKVLLKIKEIKEGR